jgi:hypothetical protein
MSLYLPDYPWKEWIFHHPLAPVQPDCWTTELVHTFNGINYFADLRMTFRQNFFLQDWFRNKFGVGLD